MNDNGQTHLSSSLQAERAMPRGVTLTKSDCMIILRLLHHCIPGM